MPRRNIRGGDCACAASPSVSITALSLHDACISVHSAAPVGVWRAMWEIDRYCASDTARAAPYRTRICPWRSIMTTQEQNERLTRVGPGTPMGNLLRRYWQPVGTVIE